jgi:signal transduction histidine kinase
MTRDACGRRGPPWWPAGEPWPPGPGGFGADRRTRGRFFRRIAVVAVALLALAVSGMFAIVSVIAGRFGLAGWAIAIPGLLVLAAGGAMASMMFRAMRRFVSPLGAVMEAADRVADGDYGVRVQEQGPPSIRALARSFNTMTTRLQHADRLRRDLMADVAHELRTPLTVLQGRLEGLLDGVYPRDDQQISELVNDTHVLSRLIEDLRVLALSEAGALPLEKEPTDVAALARDVVRSMETEASRKSVALQVTDAIREVVADLDPLRIREVLTNLVSNALRHTDTGGAVTVSVVATGQTVTVAVSDTGEGMPPDEIARIFDRFHKGPRSQGSGLGLTIAKGIVMAHGGEITASSEVGKGTRMTFTVPR